MAQTPKKASSDGALYFVAAIAWLIPGGGHWVLGQKHRGVIIFLAIFANFILGLLLASIEVIDPSNAKAWFCAQILCGLPAIITTIIQNNATTIADISIYGRGVDIGQVYTGVAGLMNLICILDALLRSQKLPQGENDIPTTTTN